MKSKFTLWQVCLMLLWYTAAVAQPAQTANLYAFSASTGGTLTAQTSPTTLIASGKDDTVSAVANIGFTFKYEGVNYTQFSVNSNGLLKLGSVVITSTLTNANLNVTDADVPKIAPLWDDFYTGTTGYVRYSLEGTGTSHTLVVEYNLSKSLTTAPSAKLQVRLHETTNVIEFVYDAVPTLSFPSATVGISGTTATKFVSVNTTAQTASTTTVRSTNTAWPGLGRVYTFTPPLTCSYNATATIAVTGSSTSCVGQSIVLTATASASNTAPVYQWSLNGTAIPTATNATYSATATGSYTVKISDPSDTVCYATSAATSLTFNAAPIITGTSATQPNICAGDSSLLAVTVTPATQQVSFSNTARYSIPDTNRFGVSSPITVTGINPSALSLSSIGSICLNVRHTWDGDVRLTLIAPSGDSILLSKNHGSSGANYTNTCFSLTSTTAVTSSSPPYTGTFKPDSIPATLSGSVNGTWILRAYDVAPGDTGAILNWTLSLNNVIVNQYAWTPSATVVHPDGATTYAKPTATTTYTVTVTDPTTTCSSTATATVNLVSALVVNLGADRTVCTPTVTLDAGNPGAAYAWSNGATTQTTTVSTTGTYSVTVTSPSGCVGGDTITLNFATPVAVNLGADTALCGGGTTTLNAGNPGATYAWSTGATTQTITVGPGTYSVTATNGICSSTDTIVVSTGTAPSATPYTACQGATLTNAQGLTAVNSCALGGTNVVTSFTGALVTGGPTFARSTEQTTNYAASSVGTAVLYSTHTFTVSVTGSYTFDLCYANGTDGFSSMYQNSFNPASPATNFIHSDDDGATACSNGPHDIVTLTAGTTYVYVATTFTNGDVGAYTVTFTGPGTVSATGGNAPLNWYAAATGGSSISSANPFNPIGVTGSGLANSNTPGTYPFYVACSNTSNCRTLVNFIINASPVVNLGPDTTQCGGSVTLNAGNTGATYAWSTGATTQTISASATGAYRVTVTNNSCSTADTINVNIKSTPVITSVTALPSTICVGDSSLLVVSGTAGSTAPVSFANNTGGRIPDGDSVVGLNQTITVSGISPAAMSINSVASVCLNITHPWVNDITIKLFDPAGDSIVLSARHGSSGDNYTNTCFSTTATQTIASSSPPYSGSFLPDRLPISVSGSVNGVWRLKVTDAAADDSGALVNWTLTLNNTPAPTYAWAPSGTLTDPTNDSTYAKPTATTPYSVTVTDAATNCTATGSVTVNVASSLVVDLGNDTTICTGSKVLDAGNPGGTYVWSTGATTQTITVTTASTYSVTVTSGSGCTGTDAIQVNFATPPTVSLGADTTQCGAGTITLNAGNAGSTYAWSNGATTQVTSVTASGIYSVTVNDGTCKAADTISVTFALPPTTTPFVTCQGYNLTTGQGLAATGGCGSAVIAATSLTGTISSGATYVRSTSGTTYSASAVGDDVYFATNSFTVSTTGSYTFDMCLANGNTDGFASLYATSFNPTNPATGFVAADDDGNDANCTNSPSITATLTAGTTYIYVASTFDNGDTGTYVVTFTGPGTVSTNSQIPLQWFTTPNGGSPIATGNTFNPIGVTGSGLTDTDTPGSTTYYVACSNAPDCRASAVFTINPSPRVALGNDTSVCASTVTLNAGNPGATYLWSNGATTQTIVVTTTGTYSVTATAGGCSAADAINVSVNALPVISSVTASPSTVCAGDTSRLMVNYTSQGVSQRSFTNSRTFFILDGDTVGISSGVVVSGIVPPTIGATTVASVCVDVTHTYDGDLSMVLYSPNGDSVILTNQQGDDGVNFQTCFTPTATASIDDSLGLSPFPGNYAPYSSFNSLNGGNVNGSWRLRIIDHEALDTGSLHSWTLTLNTYPAPQYAWAPSATLDSSNSQHPLARPTGNTTYSVTVTDGATGCSATGSVAVTTTTGPTVSLGNDTTICGGSLTLNAANPGSTYLWSNGATTQTTTVSASGTYSVIVTNGTGCKGYDTINVNVGNITVNLGNDTALCASSYTIDAGVHAGATYLWSNGATTQSTTVSTSGTYSVTVSAGAGCSATDAVVVTLNTTPVVSLASPAAQCGGSVTLDAGNPGATYLWSNSATTKTITVTTSGTYSVTVTAVGGCSATGSAQVTINPAPVVNLGNDTSLCSGTITVDAGNAGATFAWSDQSTNQTLTITTDGTYSVTVTGANGCTASDAITVLIGLPSVNLGNDTTLCATSYTLNAGNPGATYLWSDLSTGQTLNVTTTGTYSVTITRTGGCTATDTAVVTLNTPVSVNLGADISQCGGTATLDAGNAGSTYAWSTGATTQTTSISTSGAYSVTVTNGSGCSAADTVNASFGSGITVNLGADDILRACTQDTLDAGNAGATYLWSTGATTQTIVTNGDNTTRFYSVTVTANNCSAADTIALQICGGVETLAFGNVQLYPNPNEGHFSLVIEQGNATDMNIEVVSVTGQKVWTIQHENATGKYVREFDMKHLAKGVYYVRLVSGKDIAVKRVVVQ